MSRRRNRALNPRVPGTLAALPQDGFGHAMRGFTSPGYYKRGRKAPSTPPGPNIQWRTTQMPPAPSFPSTSTLQAPCQDHPGPSRAHPPSYPAQGPATSNVASTSQAAWYPDVQAVSSPERGHDSTYLTSSMSSSGHGRQWAGTIAGDDNEMLMDDNMDDQSLQNGQSSHEGAFAGVGDDASISGHVIPGFQHGWGLRAQPVQPQHTPQPDVSHVNYQQYDSWNESSYMGSGMHSLGSGSASANPHPSGCSQREVDPLPPLNSPWANIFPELNAPSANLFPYENPISGHNNSWPVLHQMSSAADSYTMTYFTPPFDNTGL